MTPSLEELRPLAAVARALGVAHRTVEAWRMRADRPLQCWRLGRRWYTTEAAVLEFAEWSTDAAAARPPDAPRPVGRPRKGADPDGDWCRERFAAKRRGRVEGRA